MCRFCDWDGPMNEVVAARHSRETEWFWTELRILREHWNVLRHPFYLRWSAAELSADELERYAGEYAHLVVALAAASRGAAEKSGGLLRQALSAHADEEEQHIALWLGFAEATGSPRWETSLAATRACAQAWAGHESRSLDEDLVALYAIEAPQPEIAQTKLDGLLEHYGFAEGPATAYFQIHAERDKEHAALVASALHGLLPVADPFGLLDLAEAVHRSYWETLTALEELRP
jgi:pyrroloquinoline-quinone synthase